MTDRVEREDMERIVREGLTTITNGRLRPGDITPDMLLIEQGVRGAESLALDSLQVLELTLLLEDEFKQELLDDAEVAWVRTVGDLYNFVDRMMLTMPRSEGAHLEMR